ncbi:hypothetical protein [Thermoleptolyngbya sp. C42_A2020_037]|uniref:hypothetical protein n=1 Tax=Thermoleptolyngbya sp. C42_A2020_037 TaxID=2747799 RepID=UPI0019E7D00B|nr:hypothetical protein [Thermoleptolyngbya sp. C42_A2020_037]MBF2086258.1 hypothetical protein [Thermoleptolyngbya sp. C42_A2020_037]
MSLFSADSAKNLPENWSENLPALLAQFRATYPAAGLIADLLTVQNSRYVVRASVVMGGLTLATGLAESASLEDAEDRALGRSLRALGLYGLGMNDGLTASVQTFGQASGQVGGQVGETNLGHTPGSAPMDAPWNRSPSVLPSASSPVDSTVSTVPPIAPASDPATKAAILPTESDWDKPDPLDPPLPPEDELDPGPVVADFYAHISASDDGFPEASEPVDLSQITKPASQISAKPSRKKSTSPSPAPEPAPPDPAPTAIDFSDILAETDVELRRLGWDAKRGREHLKATYSKRSRQELNETELYDFLDFLKSQPNP